MGEEECIVQQNKTNAILTSPVEKCSFSYTLRKCVSLLPVPIPRIYHNHTAEKEYGDLQFNHFIL